MVNRSHDRSAWVDPARSALLDDVGQPDYAAAVVVTASGKELLALIQDDPLRLPGCNPRLLCSTREDNQPTTTQSQPSRPRANGQPNPR